MIKYYPCSLAHMKLKQCIFDNNLEPGNVEENCTHLLKKWKECMKRQQLLAGSKDPCNSYFLFGR
jgi:hypothetical protein